jgi:hypothetical protein
MSLANVLTICISVLAVGTTFYLGSQRFKHDRRAEDRTDARATLADGALELSRMKAAMKDANTAFSRPMAGQADWPDDYNDLLSDLEHGKEWLEAKLAAIEIRFAESEAVVVELRDAVEAVTALISISVIARAEDFADVDRTTYSTRESNTANEKFDMHKKAFLAAAQTAVGVKLD